LRALRGGTQIVVGTPGRVIDHIERKTLDLSRLEVLVLDEADEMLRMGFIEPVQRVFEVSSPDRQVALVSATMPEPIRKVAKKHLRDPIEVQVEKKSLTVEHIDQRWMMVPPRHKTDALVRLLDAEVRGSTLVFSRTRRGCAEVADELSKRGVAVDALHGDLNQAARERVLARFRSQKLDVVVATDVAARGLDVEHITHVINLDMPEDEEVYTHRIGRTGRAGRKGSAITFVMPRERRRIIGFQRALDVKMEEMRVPSDADIDSRRRGRLGDRLTAALEGETPASLDRLLDELLVDRDPRALAAAALPLFASREGLEFLDNADDRPPWWARGRGSRDGPDAREQNRGPRPPHDGPDLANAVALFFPVGRQRGVERKHIVAALANRLGVNGGDIGRITVLDHKSFARVTQNVADKLLADGTSIELKGNEVPVVRARPRPDGPDEQQDRGPPRKPGRNPHHKPPAGAQRTRHKAPRGAHRQKVRRHK
jgi:ATP-dependent RNA helicase DeaD